jgi:YD repeat-containing protein
MSTASFLQRTGAFAAILGQFGWGSAVVYAQDLDVSVVPVYDEWELPAGTSDAMLTFEFTNRGRDAVRLDFTCSGSMGLRCRDRDLGSATLSVGASEVIRAYLDAPLQETAGVVQVLATYRGQPVAEGAYAIRVTAAGESTSQGPEVTPKGGELEAPIGAISEIEFHVRNPGLARATYELKCMVSPPVEGGCEIDENSTVDPESTAAAPARFTPDSNTTYQVTVTAAGAGGEDTGWVAVSTTGVVGPQESPTLTLDDANPGLEEERHDCPKIRAGAGSIECDDYRYDFSLGSLLRMNQARAFSLSYSSGTASPSRIIGANLTLPHTAGVEEVRAMLWVQGELQDSVVLGGEVALGVPVRLALQVTRPPSSGNTIVPYRVSATVRYSGGSTADTLSASSYYIQLDRGADRGEFGTGWWLSGYERLTPINDSDLGDVLLWSDSDGNARAYLPEPGEPGLWIARTRGRPQTILTAAQPVADEARYLDLSAFEWASTDGRPTKGLDGGSAMTWAFWVNASRSPAQFAGLHDESWLPRVWWFDITPAGLRVALQAAETGTVSTAVAHLPWDEWAFVIVQYDGAQDSTEGRLRAWVNGEEAAVFFEGQVPSSLWAEPRVALGIGRSSPSPGLVGRLGELAILRTVLSEDDKADWYAHGIDFDREGLVSGFEWHESLRDIGPAGSDLTSHTIEVEDRDFVATSEYPSRKAPVGGWRRLANMAAYHRPLSGGGEELFDAAGRHIGTVDRHGNETRFEHRLIGTASRLTSILLPTPDGPKPALELQYDSATLALRAVRAVSGDGGWLGYQIAASPTGTGFQIDGIIAPDGLSSSLTYDAGHLVALTDHRGAVTELSYDRGKVTGVRITTPDEPDVDDIAMHYRPAALVGMDPDGMFAPEPADNVTSVFDGPRADVQDSTRYFVTGWGAIRGIEDAEGNITWIDRTDPHLPGLVTRVAYPNGRVVETSYDPVTGLATSNTDHADDVAVTEYEWDTRWDSPTLIRTAAGVERRFAYDPGTGDLDSTWVGSTVARFTYDERGLLGSWTLGADAGTSFAYDSLGNLAAQTSPLGLETRYSLDQLGRVVEVRTPIALGNEAGDRIESYTYDLAGRPVLHRLANTVDDAMAWDSASYDHRGDRAATYRGGTASSRAVESFPGLERSSLPAAPLPPLTWTHDQLGRVTTVSIGGASREALQYDLAGNVTRRRTSAGDTIWLEYDRLNRLVKRRTSDRAYGPASEIVGAPDDLLSWPFPYYPTYGSDLVVPGDARRTLSAPLPGSLRSGVSWPRMASCPQRPLTRRAPKSPKRR